MSKSALPPGLAFSGGKAHLRTPHIKLETDSQQPQPEFVREPPPLVLGRKDAYHLLLALGCVTLAVPAAITSRTYLSSGGPPELLALISFAAASSPWLVERLLKAQTTERTKALALHASQSSGITSRSDLVASGLLTACSFMHTLNLLNQYPIETVWTAKLLETSLGVFTLWLVTHQRVKLWETVPAGVFTLLLMVSPSGMDSKAMGTVILMVFAALLRDCACKASISNVSVYSRTRTISLINIIACATSMLLLRWSTAKHLLKEVAMHSTGLALAAICMAGYSFFSTMLLIDGSREVSGFAAIMASSVVILSQASSFIGGIHWLTALAGLATAFAWAVPYGHTLVSQGAASDMKRHSAVVSDRVGQLQVPRRLATGFIILMSFLSDHPHSHTLSNRLQTGLLPWRSGAVPMTAHASVTAELLAARTDIDKDLQTAHVKVLRTHRLADLSNVGDLYSSPFHYVAQLNKTGKLAAMDIQVPSLTRVAHESQVVILGGGGLFGADPVWTRVITDIVKSKWKQEKAAVIAWGVGFDIPSTVNSSTIRAGSFYPSAPYLSAMKLLGVRDRIPGYRWVPCASALHYAFDRSYPIQRPVGWFQDSGSHFALPESADLGPNDIRTNAELDMARVIEFLGSTEVVLTTSYHGLYWATLLNKKVIVLEAQSRAFDLFPWPPVFFSGDLKGDIARARTYPHALSEARSANLAFWKDVKQELRNLAT